MSSKNAQTRQIVVDDQDRQAAQIDLRPVALAIALMDLPHAEPRRESERAAFASLALHADLAAHHGDQLRGDGQSQSG
ncbi:MAG TPA: hypothetical protein VK493_12670 [Bryobacteraceae bacterium]|nr:hypothetical protein [Bryobacteraceae bacterium]